MHNLRCSEELAEKSDKGLFECFDNIRYRTMRRHLREVGIRTPSDLAERLHKSALAIRLRAHEASIEGSARVIDDLDGRIETVVRLACFDGIYISYSVNDTKCECVIESIQVHKNRHHGDWRGNTFDVVVSYDPANELKYDQYGT